jgi:dsDNA-specific endonuclease/ATPase MutS2
MIQKMLKTLEFDKVLDLLQEYAVSENVRARIPALVPSLSEAEVKQKLTETTEGRMIIEHSGTPPLSPMVELNKVLSLVGKGSLLMPDQLEAVAQFLTSCRRLKAYLKKSEVTNTAVALYGHSLVDLSSLEDEIKRVIRGGQVDDRATPTLADIRRKIINGGMQIKAKLDSLLRNNIQWFSESFVSIRNGRYTLPVKKEFKNKVNGTVIDMSQSGGTYFIEPTQAAKLQDEISMLQIEEENEVRRILYMLTVQVEEKLSSIRLNIEAMETLDFIFAKARLSISMKASVPEVTTERKVMIKTGRHPLLKTECIVPLDFHIGDGTRGMVITGPNTGGKTVALKTIGLLSLMAQSGLHVPAEEALLTLNNYVLCDIGDGQSISENLSTFSSHMTNIIEILKLTDDQSLVLLDELGSGTDPAEGMGLGIAILEELLRKNCLFIATSHYPEIKTFAQETANLVNARMAFDKQTLLPLYQLEIGEAGESCALYIASRLGLPKRLIQRAIRAAYEEGQFHSSKQSTNGRAAFSPVHSENNSMAGQSKKARQPAHGDGENSQAFDGINGKDNSPMIQDNITQQNYSKNNNPPHDEGSIAELDMVLDVEKTEAAKNRIRAEAPKKPAEAPRCMRFNVGDSVIVYPQKDIGIVYRTANEKGEVGVQVKKIKLLVNHKRLKLQIPASELYPDNYDFSIIFDSVENRKARRVLDKRHDPNLVIEFDTNERGEPV